MDDDEPSSLHSGIIRYYSERLRRYGSSPMGVDWSCVASQELRFLQLLKLCDFSGPFSLNDVGCGYGALVGFLVGRHRDAEIDYLGIDLSEAMIRSAKRLWRTYPWTAFVTGHASFRSADYSVASGIFNVKLDHPKGPWERYIASTLDDLQAASRKGFAVNFLREPPQALGAEARKALYWSRPETWVRYCEREYGAMVTLLEAYGQPEFTLQVRPRG